MTMNATPTAVHTSVTSGHLGRSTIADILITEAHQMIDAMQHDLLLDDCYLQPTVVGCFGSRTEGASPSCPVSGAKT